MDAPTIEDFSDELNNIIEIETIELDAVELVLDADESPQDTPDFQSGIRQALATTGGELLFSMQNEGDDPQCVAAVSVHEGDARQLFIITIPAKGDILIEPSEQSISPLARIAPAFADVMERLAA